MFLIVIIIPFLLLTLFIADINVCEGGWGGEGGFKDAIKRFGLVELSSAAANTVIFSARVRRNVNTMNYDRHFLCKLQYIPTTVEASEQRYEAAKAIFLFRNRL